MDLSWTTRSRDSLLQRLAGLQIARAEHEPTEVGPFGGKLVGLEFTDGTRFVMEFCADLTEGAPVPWIIRPSLIEDQNMIWAPSVTRHFTRGRRQAGEKAAGWFQEKAEGEVVAHAEMLPEVTVRAGEQLLIVLRNAGAIIFQAEPAARGFSGHFALSYMPKSKWWIDRPLVVPGG